MRVVIAAVLLALAAAPAADAHSLVRPAGAVISYLSEDATSLNTLTVARDGERIVFRDPTVDGGMDTGSCTPGDTSDDANAWIIEAFCPAAGVTRLRIELREREDSAIVSAPVSATILGGAGADRLEAAAAADQLDGGSGGDRLLGGGGDDLLIGGLGGDEIDGGQGADDVRARDGIADQVRCGDGDDRVDADTLDVVDGDCERVERTPTTAPPGSEGDDGIAPQLEADAARVQRIRARRTIRVLAASSERGTVATSGQLEVGDVNLPIRTVRRTVRVAGEGIELRVVLTRAHWRSALRALRRGRRVRVRLGVVATDLAGNSRLRRLRAITLHR